MEYIHEIFRFKIGRDAQGVEEIFKCGSKRIVCDIFQTYRNVEDIKKPFWNLCNVSEEEISNFLEGLKNNWNVEESEEHGISFQAMQKSSTN